MQCAACCWRWLSRLSLQSRVLRTPSRRFHMDQAVLNTRTGPGRRGPEQHRRRRSNEWKYSATPRPTARTRPAPVSCTAFEARRVADRSASERTAWRTDHGARRRDRRARLRHQVERRRSDARPAAQGPPQPGELPPARPRPRARPRDCSRTPAATTQRRQRLQRRRLLVRLRVTPGSRRVGPAGVLTPQDLLIAFSNGNDGDGNGYVDDIAGWDFLDDDNDPYDDVQYGHGTGEARDSSAEADNGGDAAVPELHGRAAARGRLVRRRRQRLRAGDDLRGRQRGARRPGGARHAQQLEARARRGRVRVRPRRDDDRLGRRRGRAAPQLAVERIRTRSSSTRSRSRTRRSRRRRQSYLQFNGCTNFSTQMTLAIPSSAARPTRPGSRRGHGGPDLQRGARTRSDAGDLDRTEPNASA